MIVPRRGVVRKSRIVVIVPWRGVVRKNRIVVIVPRTVVLKKWVRCTSEGSCEKE